MLFRSKALHDKKTQQAEINRKLVSATVAENRTNVALKILEALAGEEAVSGDTLAGYMVKDLGNVDPKLLKLWLKKAPEHGHPLQPYVVDQLGSVVSFKFTGVE